MHLQRTKRPSPSAPASLVEFDGGDSDHHDAGAAAGDGGVCRGPWGRGRGRRIKLEIRQLDAAVDAFRTGYHVDYIPSFIYLFE